MVHDEFKFLSIILTRMIFCCFCSRRSFVEEMYRYHYHDTSVYFFNSQAPHPHYMRFYEIDCIILTSLYQHNVYSWKNTLLLPVLPNATKGIAVVIVSLEASKRSLYLGHLYAYNLTYSYTHWILSVLWFVSLTWCKVCIQYSFPLRYAVLTIGRLYVLIVGS